MRRTPARIDFEIKELQKRIQVLEEERRTSKIVSAKDRAKPYDCSLCQHTFASLEALRVHVKLHRSHEQEGEDEKVIPVVEENPETDENEKEGNRGAVAVPAFHLHYFHRPIQGVRKCNNPECDKVFTVRPSFTGLKCPACKSRIYRERKKAEKKK